MIFLEYVGLRACLSAIRGVNQVITRFAPLFLYLYVIIHFFNRDQTFYILSFIIVPIAIVLIFQPVR